MGQFHASTLTLMFSWKDCRPSPLDRGPSEALTSIYFLSSTLSTPLFFLAGNMGKTALIYLFTLRRQKYPTAGMSSMFYF